MNQENNAETGNDQNLSEKKKKSAATLNAVLIGFMLGIIAFSIWKNTVGLFTLIPLVIIFWLVNGKSENKKSQ